MTYDIPVNEGLEDVDTDDELDIELDPMVEVLVRERDRRGWSQAEVARKLGHTSQGLISQWERGIIMPGLIRLRAWAALFDMAPEMRSTKPVTRGRIKV